MSIAGELSYPADLADSSSYKAPQHAIGICLQWPDSHGCTESGNPRPGSLRAPPSAPLALLTHPLPTTPVPTQALAIMIYPGHYGATIQRRSASCLLQSRSPESKVNMALDSAVLAEDIPMVRVCIACIMVMHIYYHQYANKADQAWSFTGRHVRAPLPAGQSRAQAATRDAPGRIRARSRVLTCGQGWAPSHCRPLRRSRSALPLYIDSPDHPCKVATHSKSHSLAQTDRIVPGEVVTCTQMSKRALLCNLNQYEN